MSGDGWLGRVSIIKCDALLMRDEFPKHCVCDQRVRVSARFAGAELKVQWASRVLCRVVMKQFNVKGSRARKA